MNAVKVGGDLLGAGGMGEVYRARDTKLNRDVAIKVLLAGGANDPERLARFQRDAQALASLNHSNIAQIHGLEDSAGVPALVMELVEGPTLADRIAHGAIPFEEALLIAKQIADALEAAHERGSSIRKHVPQSGVATALLGQCGRVSNRRSASNRAVARGHERSGA